jgi:hypothetical protein
MILRAREFAMKTTEPVRPEDAKVDSETEALVKERDATFDRDKKTAIPWSEARKNILAQPLPH